MPLRAAREQILAQFLTECAAAFDKALRAHEELAARIAIEQMAQSDATPIPPPAGEIDAPRVVIEEPNHG